MTDSIDHGIGNRGQAFSVFKILIGAVFATAMLIIVYNVVESIEFPYQSAEAIRDMVINANQGRDLCFSRTELIFTDGERYQGNLSTPIAITYRGAERLQDGAIKCTGTSCTILRDSKLKISALCK
ncbi:MAG: hypothetical protein J4432_01035 [DPANN group archaeon]|nr:hypothetical protein [DPANN group archaeon]